MFDLSKRVVILTGATGNVGPTVLRAYLEQGAHVAMPVRDEAKGAALRDSLGGLAGAPEDPRIIVQGEKGAAGYAMANAALLRWSESLAEDVKREGITANCVLPRIIDNAENRAAMPRPIRRVGRRPRRSPRSWSFYRAMGRVASQGPRYR